MRLPLAVLLLLLPACESMATAPDAAPDTSVAPAECPAEPPVDGTPCAMPDSGLPFCPYSSVCRHCGLFYTFTSVDCSCEASGWRCGGVDCSPTCMPNRYTDPTCTTPCT